MIYVSLVWTTQPKLSSICTQIEFQFLVRVALKYNTDTSFLPSLSSTVSVLFSFCSLVTLQLHYYSTVLMIIPILEISVCLATRVIWLLVYNAFLAYATVAVTSTNDFPSTCASLTSVIEKILNRLKNINFKSLVLHSLYRFYSLSITGPTKSNCS